MEEFARLVDRSRNSQSNHLCIEPLEVVCGTQGISLNQFYEDYASYIAREFLTGRLTYEEADSVVNDIYGHSEFLEGLAWQIYLAFDEGEYPHSDDGRDIDPVQKYTIPMLLELFPDAHAART